MDIQQIQIGNAIYKIYKGRVYWANEEGWITIWDRVREGIFKEKCYGPGTYNHSEFYLQNTSPQA